MGTMAAVTATGTPDEPASTIDRLSDEHQRAAFPDRWRIEDVVGVDLVLLQFSPQREEMARFGDQVIRTYR